MPGNVSVGVAKYGDGQRGNEEYNLLFLLNDNNNSQFPIFFYLLHLCLEVIDL